MKQIGLLQVSLNTPMACCQVAFYFSPRGPMSCTIYDKTREIKKSGKLWMENVWRANRWDEDEDEQVIRLEYKFRREAIHETMQEGCFMALKARMTW